MIAKVDLIRCPLLVADISADLTLDSMLDDAASRELLICVNTKCYQSPRRHLGHPSRMQCHL